MTPFQQISRAGKNVIFRATGSMIKFPGFLAVYEEKFDDEEKDEENRMLPPLKEGEQLASARIRRLSKPLLALLLALQRPLWSRNWKNRGLDVLPLMPRS